MCAWYMSQNGSMDEPAAMRILSPPGCFWTKSVTSYTPSLYVTHILSFLVLCAETSSKVYWGSEGRNIPAKDAFSDDDDDGGDDDVGVALCATVADGCCCCCCFASQRMW